MSNHSYRLELGPRDDPLTIPAGQIESVDLNREHTAMGDWVLNISALFEDVQDYVLEDAAVYYEDDFIFHGELETVEATDSDALAKVQGKGIGKVLTESETTVRYQNIQTHKAIEDFWNTYTDFYVNVIPPEVDESQDELVIQQASGSSELSSLFNPADSTPVIQANGGLSTVLTHWLWDALEYNSAPGTGTAITDFDGAYQRNLYEHVNATSNASYDFQTYHTMQAYTWEWLPRIYYSPDYTGDPHIGFSIEVDGEEIYSVDDGWTQPGDGFHWDENHAAMGTFDLEAGHHTLEILPNANPGSHRNILIDAHTITDDRYNATFADTTDSNDQIATAPEYPVGVEITADPGEVDFSITRATADINTNNNHSEQEIALSPDGEDWEYGGTTTFTRFFDNTASTSAYGRVVLSSYQSNGEWQTHTLRDWQLTVDGEDLSVIQDQEFTGDHMAILQEMHNFADMRFTILHQEDGSLVAESYGRGDILQDVGWEALDTTRKLDLEDYANRVVIKGAKNEYGNRPREAITYDEEVDWAGREITYEETDPSLETKQDVITRARTAIRDKVNNREISGSQEVTPTLVDPGFTYDVLGLGGEVNLESVSYSESYGDVSCGLDFTGDADVASEITSLKGASNNLRDTI